MRPTGSATTATAGDRPDDATAMPWLIRNQRRWVNRRVESIVFVDDRTLRRRMSTDFELPCTADGRAVGALLGVMPVVVLAKEERISALDLRAEDGRALPVLTLEQSSQETTRALAADARRVLGAEPTGTVQKCLGLVAGPGRDEAMSFVRNLLGEGDWSLDGGRRLDPTSARQLELLRDDRDFVGLLTVLTQGFILYTPHDPDAPRRRVIKLAYERRISRQGRGAIKALGWQSVKFEYPLDSASRCASYHVECDAPAEAEIMRAKAFGGTGPGAFDTDVGVAGRTRTHLVLSGADPTVNAKLRVELRVQRAGFLRHALATCVLASALLLGGLLFLDEIAGDVASTSALLLVVPLALAGYVVRQGEHPFVSNLLVGVRALALVSSLCCIVAAGVLLAGIGEDARDRMWSCLFAVSVVCLAGTLVSNLLPRCPRSTA